MWGGLNRFLTVAQRRKKEEEETQKEVEKKGNFRLEKSVFRLSVLKRMGQGFKHILLGVEMKNVTYEQIYDEKSIVTLPLQVLRQPFHSQTLDESEDFMGGLFSIYLKAS